MWSDFFQIACSANDSNETWLAAAIAATLVIATRWQLCWKMQVCVGNPFCFAVHDMAAFYQRSDECCKRNEHLYFIVSAQASLLRELLEQSGPRRRTWYAIIHNIDGDSLRLSPWIEGKVTWLDLGKEMISFFIDKIGEKGEVATTLVTIPYREITVVRFVSRAVSCIMTMRTLGGNLAQLVSRPPPAGSSSRIRFFLQGNAQVCGAVYYPK